MPKSNTKHTEQHILNESFDEAFSIVKTVGHSYDPNTDTVNPITVPQGNSLATSEKQDAIVAAIEGITISSPEYAKIVDGNTDPGTFYIGIAVIGSATTDPVCQAQKIETSGDNVTITWADGNSNFDNQFNAPNTLSYS